MSFSKFAEQKRLDQHIREEGAEKGKVKGAVGGGLLGAGVGALTGGTAATHLNRIKRPPGTPRNVAGGALATLAGIGGAYLGGKKGSQVGELAGAEQEMREFDGMMRQAGVNPQLLRRYVGAGQDDVLREGKRVGLSAEQANVLEREQQEKQASVLQEQESKSMMNKQKEEWVMPLLKLANDFNEQSEEPKSKKGLAIGAGLLGGLGGALVGEEIGQARLGPGIANREFRNAEPVMQTVKDKAILSDAPYFAKKIGRHRGRQFGTAGGALLGAGLLGGGAYAFANRNRDEEE